MTNTSINPAMIERLNEDALRCEREANNYMKIANHISDIAAFAAKGNMDAAVDIIAKHDRDCGFHNVIASSTLRSNKEFMKALVENVYPDACDIAPCANEVNFKYKGFDAAFMFCTTTGFSFALPLFVDTIRYETRWLSDHVADLVGYDCAEMCSNYETLRKDHLINEDLSFAGDISSNAHARKFFDLAAGDTVMAQRYHGLRGKFRDPSKDWDNVKMSGRFTKLGNVCFTLSETEKHLDVLRGALAECENWRRVYDEFSVRAQDKGFKIANTHRMRECTWTTMSDAEREEIVFCAKKEIAKAENMIYEWESANFVSDFKKSCEMVPQ